MKLLQIACCVFLAWGMYVPHADAKLKVVSLHPYLSDLASQIGGENVEIHELMPIGGNPHTFEPTPEDLKSVAQCDIVLAVGKKLESYLPAIKDNLKPGAILVEVGKTIPSCLIDADNEIFVCCPSHNIGSVDPHWWHSVKAMKRANQVVTAAFSDKDPDHADSYKANSGNYKKELDNLHKWVKKRVSEVPRSQRYLVTAHAAFGYFCRDYGFKSLPIQGLNKEHNPKPKYLAESIETIKKHKIRVVFPEITANKDVLNAMVEESGIKVGGTLFADSPSKEIPDYIGAYTHNVNTIVNGIVQKEE